MTLLLSFVVLLTAGTATLGYRCPGEDWFYRKGTDKCYFIYHNKYSTGTGQGGVNERKKWLEAVEVCRIRGGRIITIDDASELDWITAKIPAESNWYWLGLTYQNGTWEWYDGDTYRPYTPILGLNVYEPDGTDMATKLNKRGTIRYVSNSTIRGYEFKTDTDYLTNSYICKGEWSGRPWCKTEDGWVYQEGRCYQMHDTPETFRDAEDQCIADGGHLVVPRTLNILGRLQYFYQRLAPETTSWLGLEISNKNASVTADTITWHDGTPLAQTQQNLWENTSLSTYISDLPSNASYCGEYFTRKSHYGGASGSTWLYAADIWSLKPTCDQTRPYTCETPLNRCPYGWHQFGEHCYQINLGPENFKSWESARETCKVRGADLVMIKDPVKQRFIVDLIWRYGAHDWEEGTGHEMYWIGLSGTGLSSMSQWVWIDGSWMNFKPVESEVHVVGTTLGFCIYVIFDRFSNESGRWYVNYCHIPQGFICEAHYSAVIPPDESVIPEHTCEPPFNKWHEGCYLVVNESKTYDAAAEDCRKRQSLLAPIRTRGENTYLSKLVTTDSWFGLRVTNVTGYGYFIGNLEYSFSNGAIAGNGSQIFQEFSDYYSVTVDAAFDKFCVAVAGINSTYNTTSYGSRPDRGRWYHAKCAELREYVCWHTGTLIGPPPVDDPFDAECGGGWFRNGANCYHVSQEPSTWSSAKAACQAKDSDSDLLWMTTQEEMRFVHGKLETLSSTLSHTLWIGLYAEEPGRWHWPYREFLDMWHVPFALSNWASDEPTLDKARGCSYIAGPSTEYKWYTSKCNQFRAAVCKKTLTTLTTIAPSTVTPTLQSGQQLGCPDHWTSMHDYCIKLFISAADWFTARSTCQKEQADLLSFQDPIEYQSYKRFSLGSWTGLNSIKNSNNPREFTWSNDEEVMYLPWGRESPNNHGVGVSDNDTNCGAITSEGISVYPCHEHKSFVCKKPSTPVAESTPGHTIPQSHGCQSYGTAFRGKCYYFGQDPNSGSARFLNFDDSRTFCTDKYPGSTLAIFRTGFDSSDEKEFVNAVIGRMGMDVWIGLREDENPWNAFKKWIDGSSVYSTNWAHGQPLWSGDQGYVGCVAMHGSMGDHGSIMPGDWYVAECADRKVPFCIGQNTAAPSSSTSRPSTPSPTGCPKGWTTETSLKSCYNSYEGYSVGIVKRVNWQEAEDFCQRFKNGHLVSISTAEEQQIVYRLTRSASLWIGLRENTAAQSRWEWSDGKPLTVSNFDPNTDHSSTHSPNCVVSNLWGKWIPQSCHLAAGWVCEVPQGAYYDGQVIAQFPTEIPANDTCGASSSFDGEWFFDPVSEECIFISEKEDDWANAYETCVSINANLITVTEENYPFVTLKTSQMQSFSQRDYWIGLGMTDIVNNEYSWVDGHVSYFRPWDNGQPPPGSINRCVIQSTVNGKWSVRHCAAQNYYICAKTGRMRPTRPTVDPSVGNCHNGWIQYGNHCYYFAVNENHTWNESHEACVSLLTVSAGVPSELLSIHSSLENDFLVTELRKYPNKGFWIGLNEVRTGSYQNTFVWSDHSRLTFNNWHFSEPMSVSGNPSRAAEIRSEHNRAGRWQVIQQTERRDFICKAAKDPNAPPLPPPPQNCQAGYTQFIENGPCFAVLDMPSEARNWQGAKAACEQQQGSIATITDIFENAYLRLLLHQRSQSDGLAWLGMKADQHSFAWYNGCPVVFSNFLTLMPIPDNATEQCIAMDRQGKWEARPCDAMVAYALCERRPEKCHPTDNTTSDEAYCPPDFAQECDTVCYRVQTQAHQHNQSSNVMTRSRAETTCTNYGGILASIRNEAEQQCLQKYLLHSAEGLWIGLYQQYNFMSGATSWMWEDGGMDFGPSAFQNWAPGKPSPPANSWSSNACAEIQTNGQWNNIYCYEDRGFVCEAKKLGLPTTAAIPTTTSTSTTTTVVSSSTPTTSTVTAQTTTIPATAPTSAVATLTTATITRPFPTVTANIATTTATSIQSAETGASTTDDLGGTVVPTVTPNAGLSGGSIAGIVIGVLLAVALIGVAVFIVLTGRTGTVIASARSAGTRLTQWNRPRNGFDGEGERKPVVDMDYGADTYT